MSKNKLTYVYRKKNFTYKIYCNSIIYACVAPRKHSWLPLPSKKTITKKMYIICAYISTGNPVMLTKVKSLRDSLLLSSYHFNLRPHCSSNFLSLKNKKCAKASFALLSFLPFTRVRCEPAENKNCKRKHIPSPFQMQFRLHRGLVPEKTVLRALCNHSVCQFANAFALGP